MCGIAGLFCLDPECSGSDHERLVTEMGRLQAHRGPDDSGVVSLGRLCLGATRLSILDLSPAGHMPMSDDSRRWWIAYNGEVYNFRDLRETLERRSHRFRSQTDTEVVLHAYMEWGEACIERFVGMFAFAVYDREAERLVLVRDRYGIKPLYYARSGGHVLFASEIKALARANGTVRVDRQRLTEWYLYRNVDALGAATLFEGISSVLPGHRVEVTREGIAAAQVYRVASHVSRDEFERYTRMRPRDVVDELDATLNEATELRLVSDVPVGTLLSGGLDSSLITTVAARYKRDLTAFNVSVAGYPALDERRFAEELARNLGLELVSLELSGEIFRRELPHAVYLSDHPLSHPNSVAYHLISRVARERGVIVLLSGEGADELFGGYAWNYRRKWYLLKLAPLLERLPRRAWNLAALFIYSRMGMPVTSIAFRDLLPPFVRFVDRYERGAWLAECEDAYRFVLRPNERAVLSAILADLNDFLSPLLRRLDRMSMGASVECRVPYLDHRLVHRAINLPLAYRIGARSDKWVLKEVAKRYVPSHIIRRKKAGFPLPLADYIEPLARREFFDGGFCQEELGLNARGLDQFVESWRDWIFGFFGLVTLEIWGRLFVRRESADQVEEWIGRIERAGPPGA
ncbi:MAG TPA: asparagine synthase (glutamine-hydrolyzing) [Gemmatimonadota bacterium]|nr:asparagine synthase (glutamine-hydrolyzing) [Gemmatimonadota bacterium]